MSEQVITSVIGYSQGTSWVSFLFCSLRIVFEQYFSCRLFSIVPQRANWSLSSGEALRKKLAEKKNGRKKTSMHSMNIPCEEMRQLKSLQSYSLLSLNLCQRRPWGSRLQSTWSSQMVQVLQSSTSSDWMSSPLRRRNEQGALGFDSKESKSTKHCDWTLSPCHEDFLTQFCCWLCHCFTQVSARFVVFMQVPFPVGHPACLLGAFLFVDGGTQRFRPCVLQSVHQGADRRRWGVREERGLLHRDRRAAPRARRIRWAQRAPAAHSRLRQLTPSRSYSYSFLHVVKNICKSFGWISYIFTRAIIIWVQFLLQVSGLAKPVFVFLWCSSSKNESLVAVVGVTQVDKLIVFAHFVNICT